MLLDSLLLTNFRNYKSAKLKFAKLNIFLGDNSVGKTNLLEAIYFLSFSSPFNLRFQKDLINKNSTFSRLEGVISTKNRKLNIVSILELRDEKTCEKKTIINKKLKKTNEFIGKLKVVSFLPSDIGLISSTPSEKRLYFDNLLIQIDPSYCKIILNFEKIVNSRNKLLESIRSKKAQKNELLFWDKELIESGLSIFLKRQKLTTFLNKLIEKIYQKLTISKNQLAIYYKPFLRFGNLDIKRMREKYQSELRGLKEKEIDMACSLLGPHRDDLIFNINNQKLTSLGSRSEYREAILALKISESKLIEKVTDEKPILLLDDIGSELDDKNKIYLFSFLEKYILSNSQIFITTTSLEQINKPFLEKASIFKISKGDVCLLN